MKHTFRFIILLLMLSGTANHKCNAQDTSKLVPDGTEGEVLVTRDSLKERSNPKPWNQFDLGFTTMKIGIGVLYEYAAFSQDEEGKIQADTGNVDLQSKFKVRDFRFLLSGKLNTKRAITWKTGIMYDAPSNSWFIRETGVTIAVPELWGHIFVGRTKEGFSLNKVMNGYAGWTMERQMALDVIPILADGIKWMGYLPKQHILWNAGIYTDWSSKGQSFSTYKWQTAMRVAWLPIYAPQEKKLLHIGMNFRYGKPVDNVMRLRSRPEANPAPYFIDTDTFPANHSVHFGPEVYYTNGSLMIGSEYYFHKFIAPGKENYLFNGGDVVLSYILTGESRPYTTDAAIYSFVPVNRPVFKGGPGAWEVLVRLSHLDLNDGKIQGGKFWRVTPMVNWYLSRYVRLEFAYGYGVLERYNLNGTTQFFQTRLQITIL